MTDIPATDVAWILGPVVVRIEDVARAIAVQAADGEAMTIPVRRDVLVQDARDILDRAFRYARDRRK